MCFTMKNKTTIKTAETTQIIVTNKVLFEVSSLVVLIVEFTIVVLLLIVTVTFVLLFVLIFAVVVSIFGCFTTERKTSFSSSIAIS